MIESLNLRPEAQPAESYRVGLVSTYPPTRCGIARFSSSFVTALHRHAPELSVELVRLVDTPQPSITPTPVSMEIDPNSGMSVRAAARHLNQTDVVVIQHEYGIYGDNDGESVLGLVEGLHRPTVTVLHTVVRSPSANQRRIIQGLGDAGRLVVLSEAARSALAASHGIPRSRVVVIPHGAQWSALPSRRRPDGELITWGLLGPGKGLERSIAAMALLRDLDPLPHYRIVGRTHPAVLRRYGTTYRRQLERLVDDLGVGHMVTFIDRYVSDEELLWMVGASDLVVVPYDNNEQVSSGVLTDAVGAGRPVVATRFPHAEELLETGAGRLVDHDSDALAGAIRELLSDHHAYRRAVSAAAGVSTHLSWETTAGRYASLLRSLLRPKALARPN